MAFMCGELLWNWLINIAANPQSTDEQSYFSKSPVGVEVSDSPGYASLAKRQLRSVVISGHTGAGQVPWTRLKGQGDLQPALFKKPNET